jgi:hypothetical protein
LRGHRTRAGIELPDPHVASAFVRFLVGMSERALKGEIEPRLVGRESNGLEAAVELPLARQRGEPGARQPARYQLTVPADQQKRGAVFVADEEAAVGAGGDPLRVGPVGVGSQHLSVQAEGRLAFGMVAGGIGEAGQGSPAARPEADRAHELHPVLVRPQFGDGRADVEPRHDLRSGGAFETLEVIQPVPLDGETDFQVRPAIAHAPDGSRRIAWPDRKARTEAGADPHRPRGTFDGAKLRIGPGEALDLAGGGRKRHPDRTRRARESAAGSRLSGQARSRTVRLVAKVRVHRVP